MVGRNDDNRGAVLILAILTMTACIVLGVMYLERSATYLSSQFSAYQRLQARAYADGAIELGHQQLIEEPTYRGTLPTATNEYGSYTVSIVSVGPDAEIQVQATVGNAKATWTSRFELNQWTEKTKLTFNNPTSEDLIDFQVLVLLDSGRIDYSKTQDGGQDIRFVDRDGTILPYEIELWDETGTSSVWVTVPQIDALSSGDHIWMLYSNPGATDDQNPASVWGSDYLLVWHCNETSGTRVRDSSVNFSDGTKRSASEPNPTTTGRIGGAQSYDGRNDGALVAGLRPSVTITMEAWIYPRNFVLDEWGTIAQFDYDQPFLGFCESPDTPAAPVLNFWRGSRELKGSAIIPTDTWSYVAATHDGSTANMYLNGTLDQTGTVNENDRGRDLHVGIWELGTNDSPFDGTLDEIRISKVVRSAAWVSAQHLSMSDAFITFGPTTSSSSAEIRELWRRPAGP